MTPQTLATLRAALLYWSERNLPVHRRALMAELELIASGGRAWPLADAEEIAAMVATLQPWPLPYWPGAHAAQADTVPLSLRTPPQNGTRTQP
jgi:hypothetical protein